MPNYYVENSRENTQHDMMRSATQGAQLGLRWLLLGSISAFKAIFGFISTMISQVLGGH
jgi:hypothetical protein